MHDLADDDNSADDDKDRHPRRRCMRDTKLTRATLTELLHRRRERGRPTVTKTPTTTTTTTQGQRIDGESSVNETNVLTMERRRAPQQR